jgi:predicted nucleic acid-binding protein
MRLVVDANVLVAEAFRERGRALVTHSALDLFIAGDAWSETTHELRRRVSFLTKRGVLNELWARMTLDDVIAAILGRLTIVQAEQFVDRYPEATWRIPRDPLDVPTVALALAFECGIWTNDRDFFGCGLPVWSTDVLRSCLENQGSTAT